MDKRYDSLLKGSLFILFIVAVFLLDSIINLREENKKLYLENEYLSTQNEEIKFSLADFETSLTDANEAIEEINTNIEDAKLSLEETCQAMTEALENLEPIDTIEVPDLPWLSMSYVSPTASLSTGRMTHMSTE